MKGKWLLVLLSIFVTAIVVFVILQNQNQQKEHKEKYVKNTGEKNNVGVWQAPDINADKEATGEERKMILYGQELIIHTAKYFGPKGTISQSENGMNCQNCHLDAGTRPWGNNLGAAFANHPQLRGRSNKVQDLYDRINDCFERSLNGKKISKNTLEMQSIFAYLKCLGRGVGKGLKPTGTGLPQVAFINRASDRVKGKGIYINTCQACHGANGQGVLLADGKEFAYPPLWGGHSYNDGAGMLRLSTLAAFAFNNMPFNQATHKHPKVSVEEAWDVAAFVNSQPRPHFNQIKDWPDVTKKPFDAPFGPYTDSFNEEQHKYGPYEQIVSANKAKQKQ